MPEPTEPQQATAHASPRPTTHESVTDDDGFTLVELIVAIGVFTLFIGLILSTTVTLSQSAVRSRLIAETSNATITLFGALDRQARYADSINFPGVGSSGARYIEFRTPANSAASGVTTCTQWRYLPAEGRIESRSWADIGGATPTPWSTKMSDVLDGDDADYPFALVPADLSTPQKLVVSIRSGVEHLEAGSTMTTTFVARNSSIQSPSNVDADNNKVSDTPVCLATGDRP